MTSPAWSRLRSVGEATSLEIKYGLGETMKTQEYVSKKMKLRQVTGSKQKSQCYHAIGQMRPTRVKHNCDEVGPIAERFQVALPGPR